MSKFDVSKMMVEAALTKALKELKSEPETSIRKWLERKGNQPKGAVQQALLMQIKTMLQDPSSAYHTLIKRVMNHVQFESLKTIGMNFGYSACTAGTKTIRSQELIYDVHIPWTVSFDMDGSVKVNHVDSMIEQGKKLGIYVYQLHCRTKQAVFDLPQLFEKQKECTFIVYLEPEVVSARFIEQYGRHRNFLLAVACHERHADEEFSMLKKAGFLYAANYEYDASNVEQVFSGRYIEYAADVGAVFALAWPKASAKLPLREQVYGYMSFVRMEQRQPILAIEVVRDTLNLDRLLSDEAAFLCFNDSGQRINIEKGYAEGEENLFQQTFLQILEAL